MTVRMTMKQWETVLRNVEEAEEEIEVTWLDSTNEYVINVGEDVLEDGYNTEEEAYARLLDVNEACGIE